MSDLSICFIFPEYGCCVCTWRKISQLKEKMLQIQLVQSIPKNSQNSHFNFEKIFITQYYNKDITDNSEKIQLRTQMQNM